MKLKLSTPFDEQRFGFHCDERWSCGLIITQRRNTTTTWTAIL